MALWFLRGVRRGVVTTRYPARDEPSARDLPTPPEFVAGGIDADTAELLAASCPSRALRVDGDALVYDVGACTACGTCERLAPASVVRSGLFELAAVRREQLLKRIPIGSTT
jgi:ferredoxin